MNSKSWIEQILAGNKYVKATAIIIIIGVFMRILYSLFVYPSSDGGCYLGIARFMAETGTIPLFEQLGRGVFDKPPLFHLISAFLYFIFSGINEQVGIIAMKLVSPLASIPLLVFSYLIARHFYNSKISTYAVAFVAFLPMNLYFNSKPWMDTLFFAFFVICVYLALKNRFYLLIFFSALLCYSNQRAFFVFPIIVYIIYTHNPDLKKFIIKSMLYISITLALFSPWLIRNYILLGNPIWPMFNSLFPGSYPDGIRIAAASNLLNINEYLITYFELFAIPGGNIFLLESLPFSFLLIPGVSIASVIYLFPLFLGLFKGKKNFVIFGLIYSLPLILSNIMVFYFHQNSHFRYLMPITLIMGMLWGLGIDSLKNKTMKTILMSVLVCVMVMFSISTLAAIKISSNYWSYYEEDFDWIKENTEDDAKLFVNIGQDFYYSFHREIIMPTDYGKKDQYEDMYLANYVFRNDGFMPRNIVFPDNITAILDEGEDFLEVYTNNKTGTIVYKNIKS